MKNQILSVDEPTKNKKSKRTSSSIDIKKIVIFFAIAMIVFSFGAIGVGTYAIAKNNNFSIGNKPNINAEENNGKLNIITSSEIGIDKIVYVLNDEENEITGNGETSLEEEIDLELGTNKIKINVYDINGKVAKFEQEYNVDITAPQLSISGSNGKIKITAKDNIQMSYITYRWDDEEETKVEATEESSAQIEEEVEIPRGQHTLTVVAVNTNNLTTTKEQEVKGVKKPSITVVQDADDLKYLVMTVYDEEAVKIIDFTLNGQQYQIDLSDYNEKTIQYKIEMKSGENNITITAENFDGAKATFEGVCTYNP